VTVEQQLRDEDARLEDEERKETEKEHLGTQARLILDHPLVIEAFSALEDGAFNAWKNSTVADRETREKLFLQYQAMQQFRRFFEETMDSGKIAKAYLPDIRKQRRSIRERLKGFMTGRAA